MDKWIFTFAPLAENEKVRFSKKLPFHSGDAKDDDKEMPALYCLGPDDPIN